MVINTHLKTIITSLLPDRILHYLRKVHYLNKLKSFSENDEVEMGAVKKLIERGDSTIDIGANYGFYTLFLSRLVGEEGLVYSFEPVPATFKILSNNVKKLKLYNVKLYNCGISEREGKALFEIPRYDSGGENYYRAKIIDSINQDLSLRHFPVQLTTLDSVLSNLSRDIAFVKIDVEGHELQAINGSMQLLRRFKPALLVEVSGNPDDCESPAFKLFNILEKEGYEPYRYDGHQLTRRNYGEKSINYFFLCKNHIENYRKKSA